MTLKIRGISVGGDADEVVNLRAHGGLLDIDSTHILSWDTNSQSVDDVIEDGRSYIFCLSEVLTDLEEKCEGRAKTTWERVG